MFCFYFHWFSQVLEDGNGAGGANSPREGGSSDELWAQMQVLLIANLKNSLSCDFQNNRQTMQCWRLHEALQCQLEGPGSTSTETILRICALTFSRNYVKWICWREVFFWFLKPSNPRPPRLICDRSVLVYQPQNIKQAISDIYRTFTEKYIW